MLSGHKTSTRGCGNRAAGICLCETHSFGGHVVDTGSGYELLSVAAKISVAHIVTHYVDDVGLLLGLGHFLCIGRVAGRYHSAYGTEYKLICHN